MNRIAVILLSIIYLAAAKQDTVIPMARPSRLLPPLAAVALTSPTNALYTLWPVNVVDASSATTWTIVVATSSGGTGRTFNTSIKTFGVSNLDYQTRYFIRSQGGSSPSNSTSVTLGWDASVSPSIAGYNVYRGTKSRSYDNMVGVGNAFTAHSDDLVAGTNYFFAVTCFDITQLESAFSDEVSYTAGAGVNPVMLRLGGTTNPPVSELIFPPTVENYVVLSLDYFSASLNQWVTNYASLSYTNPLGIGLFRYRNGDKTNSPNANNRAWQTATSVQGPWQDIPTTLVQGTNAGPIRFSITNWHNITLSDYQIPE